MVRAERLFLDMIDAMADAKMTTGTASFDDAAMAVAKKHGVSKSLALGAWSEFRVLREERDWVADAMVSRLHEAACDEIRHGNTSAAGIVRAVAARFPGLDEEAVAEVLNLLP